jgi:hypothetical protein
MQDGCQHAYAQTIHQVLLWVLLIAAASCFDFHEQADKTGRIPADRLRSIIQVRQCSLHHRSRVQARVQFSEHGRPGRCSIAGQGIMCRQQG